jgi:hypothetical protein
MDAPHGTGVSARCCRDEASITPTHHGVAASLCICAAARGHADRLPDPVALDVGRGAQGDR